LRRPYVLYSLFDGSIPGGDLAAASIEATVAIFFKFFIKSFIMAYLSGASRKSASSEKHYRLKKFG